MQMKKKLLLFVETDANGTAENVKASFSAPSAVENK